MARRSRATAQLRAEVNTRWPNRKTHLDGWIGDSAHAARKSDHNPNSRGVVQAEDITDDQEIAQTLWLYLLALKDRRIKYVIWHKKMFSSYPVGKYKAWQVRPYNGPNGHLTHIHISVQDDPYLYDDMSKWGIAKAGPTAEGELEMRNGWSGPAVKLIQQCLINEAKVAGREKPLQQFGPDGHYGSETEEAVRRYQNAAKIPATGIVDGITSSFLLRYEEKK